MSIGSRSIEGNGASRQRKRGDSSLSDIARELASKLSSRQALVVLLVVVAGLVLVQVAAKPNAGEAIWAVVAILVVGEVAAFGLNYLDSTARARGLDQADSRAVRGTLEGLRRDVARQLGVGEDRCRANVFGEITGARRLQIVDQLMANMDEVAEWDISIPVGKGASGIAWHTRSPKIVLFPPRGDEDLSPEEAARVDPDLKWIVSVPIAIDGSVKWVVNVDGEDARTREQLEPVVRTVQGAVPSLVPFARKA